MRKIFSIFFTFFFFFLFFFQAKAANYPSPSGFVNDFASLYSEEFKIRLEDKLRTFKETSQAEIAVVTVLSLEGEPIEDYANKLFEKWKIGNEYADNGLLFIISREDREVRIEVGYGLEPFITDSRAGDIIRGEVIPEFKKGNYENGTINGVDKLINFVASGDIAPKPDPKDERALPALGIIIGGFLFAVYIASFLGRSREIWPGGAIGAFLGFIIGIFSATFLAAVLFAVFAGFFGLFLDFILSRNFKLREKKGLPTGFWHSGGGFSSGGGGASFGGFGGGSSGGGGASGKW